MSANEPEKGPEPEDDKLMSLWEHLDELRSRLTKAAMAYVAAMFAAWAIKDHTLAWLWRPFVESWKAEKLPGEPKLHFAAPGDAFLAYFKLSMIAGLALAAPVIFYQLWSFIAPGLYRKEKRYAFGFVLLSSIFFVGGGLFGWRLAFPISFQYFLGLTTDAAGAGIILEPTVMVGDYLDFVSQMLLAFGLIFELPLLLTFLSLVGLVNYLQLYRFGRWFIMIASVIGAVLSPPDTTSMIVMTVPLVLLYFLSIGLAYIFGQKPSPEELARYRQEQEDKRLERERARIAKREMQRAERERELEEQRAERAQKEAERERLKQEKKKLVRVVRGCPLALRALVSSVFRWFSGRGARAWMRLSAVVFRARGSRRPSRTGAARGPWGLQSQPPGGPLASPSPPFFKGVRRFRIGAERGGNYPISPLAHACGAGPAGLLTRRMRACTREEAWDGLKRGGAVRWAPSARTPPQNALERMHARRRSDRTCPDIWRHIRDRGRGR